MDKKKELEALEKEARRLCKLREEAEDRVKTTPKYQRLGKVVEQLRKKRERLQTERNKLWKKAKKRFISGEIDYPTYARNANAFYGGDTNILPKVLRAIEKVAPLSRLKASQIEEVVNLLIMKEEERIPKLAKVLIGITIIDQERDLAWDTQDKLNDEADIFSDKIDRINEKINSLKEEIKYPGRVKEKEEREDIRSLVFNNIDKIYEALTKKRRR